MGNCISLKKEPQIQPSSLQPKPQVKYDLDDFVLTDFSGSFSKKEVKAPRPTNYLSYQKEVIPPKDIIP